MEASLPKRPKTTLKTSSNRWVRADIEDGTLVIRYHHPSGYGVTHMAFPGQTMGLKQDEWVLMEFTHMVVVDNYHGRRAALHAGKAVHPVTGQVLKSEHFHLPPM